jgi:hypothetical protein
MAVFILILTAFIIRTVIRLMALMMEAVRISVTLVNLYRSTHSTTQKTATKVQMGSSGNDSALYSGKAQFELLDCWPNTDYTEYDLCDSSVFSRKCRNAA